MKKTLLFLSLALSFNAQEIVENSIENKTFVLDYSYLNSLERGIKRDFYINEYLKTDINSTQAFETLKLIDNMTDELFINFAIKFKDDETLATAQCLNMDTKELIYSYADCIAVGLNLKKLSKLSSVDLNLLSQKLFEKYPTFVKKIEILASPIPFTKLIVQKEELIYDIFFNVSKEFRENFFNYKLPKRTFEKIFKNKEQFNKFLDVSIKNPNLDKLNKSLLEVDDKELNANSSFLLAINAYTFNNIDRAMFYLDNSLNKSNDRKFKNKTLFWKYIISKNRIFLEELISFSELDFYILFANEIEKKELNFPIDLFKNKPSLDSKKFDIKRIALLYSILEVESNFNPKKISKDFRIGISQLNQKILKTISLLLNEEYNLQKQFILEESLRYANTHLNTLEKISKNPIETYLLYISQEESLDLLSKFKNFKENDLKGLAFFEYLENSDKIKEFISFYYLYTNSLAKSKKDKITLFSIFENLIELNQIKSEKVLK